MKRALLCKALRRTGLLRLLNLATPPSVTILNYHRIAESTEELAATRFDSETYSCTAADLREQIRAIRKFADIISMDDLARLVRERRRPGRHAVALTFDDGYIDNYSLAFPVLKQERCPACFFIPTRPIEERVLGWWDQIAYVLKTAENKVFKIDYPEVIHIDLVRDSADSVARNVFSVIKRHTEIDYDRLIAELADAAGSTPPGTQEASSQLMSWAQIREMQDGGMTIGAHGHTHFIFSHMSAEAQREDIRVCHDILRKKIGKKPLYLSYPVGNRNHYTKTTQRIARELGFQLAFNFALDSTRIDTRRAHPFDLDRKPVSWPTADLVAAQASGLAI